MNIQYLIFYSKFLFIDFLRQTLSKINSFLFIVHFALFQSNVAVFVSMLAFVYFIYLLFLRS